VNIDLIAISNICHRQATARIAVSMFMTIWLNGLIAEFTGESLPRLNRYCMANQYAKTTSATRTKPATSETVETLADFRTVSPGRNTLSNLDTTPPLP
jgi:hypothetical protein